MTGINSTNNIEVDGMPRHLLDFRRVGEEVEELANNEEESVSQEEEPRYPPRDRHAPRWIWMRDYVSQ